MALAEDIQGALTQLEEGVSKADTSANDDALTDEELAAFLEEHPMVRTLLFEGFDFEEIMEAMDAGLMKLAERAEGNPGNNPFRTAPLHDTSSAGKGGGKRPNGRKKTGECTCGCSNYVCKCNCDDGMRTIDMTDYYSSGRKAAYMSHWRKNHGKEHS